MANTSPILHQNKQFLFSFNSKAYPHSFSSLLLKKPVLSFSFSPSSSSSSSSSSSVLLSPSSSSPSLLHQCYHVTRVSTAPVECAAPAPDFDFHKEIARLKAIRSKLGAVEDLKEKNSVIESDSGVARFFSKHKHGFASILASLDLDLSELFLLKCLIAAGQEHVLCLGYGEEFEERKDNLARGSVKSALYALVEMIERLDVKNGGNDGLGKTNGVLLHAAPPAFHNSPRISSSKDGSKSSCRKRWDGKCKDPGGFEPPISQTLVWGLLPIRAYGSTSMSPTDITPPS